jgi:hypothetical protein
MTNQRRHERFAITGIATLKFEDKGEIKTTQATLSTISSEGIGLYVDSPIKNDTYVSLTIHFISGDGIKNNSIKGSVLYNRDLGKRYFIGIQFNEDINSKNQPLLYTHLQKIINWNK